MTRRKALLIIIAVFFLPITYLLIKRSTLHSKYSAKNLESYRRLISEIADTIIPRTDTPGAKDANVDSFIINVMQKCESKRSRATFVLGLESVERESNMRFGMSFLLCSDNDKEFIMREIESKQIPHPFLKKVKTKLFGPSFFDQIKVLTVKGYCMSKEGATKGLAYDPLPKRYVPCTSYIQNQKAWATR